MMHHLLVEYILSVKIMLISVMAFAALPVQECDQKNFLKIKYRGIKLVLARLFSAKQAVAFLEAFEGLSRLFDFPPLVDLFPPNWYQS